MRAFVNGTNILNSDNMHRTYEVDIKSVLKQGDNTIHAIFRSPVEFALRKQAELPLSSCADAVEGISHLRKAHSMFGWDWGRSCPILESGEVSPFRGMTVPVLTMFILHNFTSRIRLLWMFG